MPWTDAMFRKQGVQFFDHQCGHDSGVADEVGTPDMVKRSRNRWQAACVRGSYAESEDFVDAAAARPGLYDPALSAALPVA
jgi:hypothetical protein